jgi:hypothetical protein
MALLTRFRARWSTFVDLLKITDDSPVERRSRFKARLLVLAVGLPLPPLVLVAVTALHVVSRDLGRGLEQWIPFLDLGFGLFLAPAFLFRSVAKPPPPSQDEDDDQGGWRDPPPGPPTPPRGGLPLPKATQSRSRVRDHTGRRSPPVRTGRDARKPARSPLAPTRR